jgi:hypothetical protein
MDVGSAAGPEPTVRDKAEEAEQSGETRQAGDGTAQGTTRDAATAALSDRLPVPQLFPVLAYAVTWVLLLISWQVANALYQTPWPWKKYFYFADGVNYNWIAVHTYNGVRGIPASPGRAAYFPVLPLLSRTVADITNHSYLPAEMAMQVVVGAASAVAVWALAAHIGGHRVADRATLLYVAFPGAMTFGMFYPEPLGNLLAATSLLAALNRKWLLAGLLALVASAEHPALLVLAPTLAVTAVLAIKNRREWQALIAPALAPLGAAWYFGLLTPDFHDFFFWFHDQGATWRGRADWIGHELRVLTWTDPGTSKHVLFNVIVIVMAVSLVAGIALMLRARVPLPVSLYTVLAVLAFGMANAPGPTPRFAWTALGIFVGAGMTLPRWAFWPLVIVSAGLLAFLFGWWPHQGPTLAP